jgi:uncharacterized DUF497 family protein
MGEEVSEERVGVYYSRILVEMAGSEIVSQCTGFQWDEHNVVKNWERHQASVPECEEVFFNIPLVVQDDPKHSQREPRFYCLGQTDAGRPLFLVFTIRGTLIRVISARDMSRKEREVYQRS